MMSSIPPAKVLPLLPAVAAHSWLWFDATPSFSLEHYQRKSMVTTIFVHRISISKIKANEEERLSQF
jgi:hypothetical protein